MSEHQKSLNYTSYLALEEILGAQRPRSEEHDEILFIVVHQVYELWFKQLIHELGYLQRMLEEGNEARASATFKRLLTILKIVVAQLDVIETMTPVQFLAFRERLEAASGFQSAQFRELEAILGRRDPGVLHAYHEGSVDHDRVDAAMARPAVYDSFLRYLAARGYEIPAEVLERDVTQPVAESDGVQRALLEVYRDDGAPAQVCERMVDFDEGFMEWRYHHVKMVERTIGERLGTGGSPGAAYLRTTLPPAVLPGPLGRPHRALMLRLAELGRRTTRAFRVAERLLLTGPLAPGLAGRGARGRDRSVGGRCAARGREVGARVRQGRARARGFRGLLGDPTARSRSTRTRTGSCCASCRRSSCGAGRGS